MFTTVRGKFHFLYGCIALLLIAVAIVASSYSWRVYSEKQRLLEEYNVFRRSTKAIHMLQKERGLTVKNLFRRASGNIEELKAMRVKTHAAIVDLSNVLIFQEILERHVKLHEAIDSDAISPRDSFLEYSDIIYEIITSLSSDQTFEHVQHDHLFLSLTNLVMAREHLGKTRAFIAALSKGKDVDDMAIFYVKEKFGLYGVAKAEFLRSVKGKYPSYLNMIVEDGDVKGTERAILLLLGEERQFFDYSNWFDLSTKAMDVYYGIESELADKHGEYLEGERDKARTDGLLVLCVTVVAIAVSGYFVGRFVKSFSSRVENIDAKMKFILETNNYKIEIMDRGHDEISGISNSLNSLLKFTNELLEEKEKMASTDRLTGAYNRRKFVNIFEAELQRFSRYQTTFSVIMMDIDHFKRINDNYGHNVGDNVLVEVTSMTAKMIRATDILVRWGGEEFIVLASSSDLCSAVALAEKIRFAIAEHTFSVDLKVTMSFGVSEIQTGDSLETIMARVDAALYESKRTGRNKVCPPSEKG